jgi:hypothetical protein
MLKRNNINVSRVNSTWQRNRTLSDHCRRDQSSSGQCETLAVSNYGTQRHQDGHNATQD